MHFSVPHTQEFVDNTGSAYVGYHVHINGLYHCTVRYKQLHNLYEQLLKNSDSPLPDFPKKKIFPLTLTQLEERKAGLDKFIQTIGQNTNVNNIGLLYSFLLCAQVESATCSENLDENIDIFLMDGTKINFDASLIENSGQLLKKCCKKFGLDIKFCVYFSLFIVYQYQDQFIVLRKLQDFESPIITMRNMQNLNTRIVIGKWYWDTAYDKNLLHDPISLKLLYAQTTSELERGWIVTTEKVKHHLENLKFHGSKEKYIEVAQSLKYYGHMQFAPCICDYPKSDTKVVVTIGKNELNIRATLSNGLQEEISFKVTRMRCWRIITVQENDKSGEDSDCSLELSFEYLMSKDQLKWITISSNQAILMSVCLQSMIDELLLKTVDGVRSKESIGQTWTYMTRNGCIRNIAEILTLEVLSENVKENENSNRKKSEPILKKLTERFSAIKVSKSPVKSPNLSQERRSTSDGELLENNAFCMIGDDDL